MKARLIVNAINRHHDSLDWTHAYVVLFAYDTRVRPSSIKLLVLPWDT